MVRGATFNVTLSLITEECADCGIVFGVPTDFQARRRNDHRSFYCPHGHSLSYGAESESERLKRELQEAKDRHHRDLNSEINRRIRAEDDAMDLANSNRALKGVVTKTKKRAAAGVCPCCHRTISQMARHMKTKHPGYEASESPHAP